MAPLLATVSVLIGHARWVRAVPGWSEPPHLWISAVGDSGNGKMIHVVFRDNEGLGHRSSIPVFIIGMPRSGTTLVEQVLASHPKVFGAGEVTYFADAVTQLCRLGGTPSGFPDGVP